MLRRRVDFLTGHVFAGRGLREALARDAAGGGGQVRTAIPYFWALGALALGAVATTDASSPPQTSVPAYVNFAEASGSSSLLENVDGGVGGLTPVRISYAYNGVSGDRTGELVVNGVVHPITFSTTGGFGIWKEMQLYVVLSPGATNSFLLRSTGADLANVHALNVYVKLVADPPPPTPPPAPPPSPAPPPPAAPGAPQLLQAEDGVFSGGVVLETSGVNFQGAGAANFPLTGGKVEWTGVHGGTGGSFLCYIRYAFGNSGQRRAIFRVNGVAQEVIFPATGTWDTYVDQLAVYGTATPGATNTISIESNGEDCGNIDSIYFIPNTAPPVAVTNEPYEIQAEDMILSGGAVVESSNGAGFTGVGYVNYLTTGSRSEKANCNGGISGGVARIDIYQAYDGNTGPTRTGRFLANATAYNLVTPETDGWNDYQIVSIYVTLVAGFNNLLAIETIGQDLGNIDKIKVFPNTAPPPTPAPPPPAPAPTPPAPPPPAPAPGVRAIDESDIFATIDIASRTFAAGEKGGAGAEWGNNQKTSVSSLSNTLGLGAMVTHGLASGPLGNQRFGKTSAPEGDGRAALAISGYYGDGETAGAPRTEGSWWWERAGSIANYVKRDIWFAFGYYMLEGFPISGEAAIAQWHTNGIPSGTPGMGGYAGQPFWALFVKNNSVVVQNRWNNNPYINPANTSSVPPFNLAAMVAGQWNYFVVKARISPRTSDNPYMKMWRATGPAGILTQVIDSSNPLGYTGFDSVDRPWQKFGHYPWGYNTNSNRWTEPLTRRMLFRCPVYVDDPTSKYLPADLLAHVRAR